MSFWISIFSQPIHTLEQLHTLWYSPTQEVVISRAAAHARLSQDELLGMSGVQIRAHLHNNSAWLV